METIHLQLAQMTSKSYESGTKCIYPFFYYLFLGEEGSHSIIVSLLCSTVCFIASVVTLIVYVCFAL